MGVKVTDNTDEVMQEINKAVRKGLERCGQKAEGYAKLMCPVDSGLLRNSITHVVDGEYLSANYHADSPGKNGAYRFGSYSFTAPAKDEPTVTIGSNVEYAPYVEMGHIQAGSGRYIYPERFLEMAATNHGAEYKSIINDELSKLS